MAFSLGKGVITLAVSGVAAVKSAVSSLTGSLGGVITLAVSGVAAVKSVVSSLTGSLGKIGALAGVGSISAFFGKAVWDAAEAQVEIAKLNQALTASKGIAGVTGEEIDALATEIERMSGLSGEGTMAAAAMLTQFRNVRGDQFKEVLKVSADVAARLGGDVPSAAQRLGEALNDPMRGLMKLRMMGVVFSAQQQEMMKEMLQSGDVMGVQNMMLERLSGTFGGAAASMGQTFHGQLSRLNAAIGDVAKGVGMRLLPHIQKLTEWVIQVVVPNIGSWVDSLTEVGATIWGWLVPILTWLKDVVVNAFTVARDFFAGWGDTVKWVIYESIASFYEFMDTVGWIFGVSIPRLFEWFCNNWYNLFMDAVVGIGTIFNNLFDNIVDFFSNLWNYITTWGESGWTFNWKPLLDGFQAVTEEVPNLMEGFDFGPEAKKWREKVEGIGKDFPQAVADGIDSAPDVIGDAVKGAAQKYNVNVGKVSVEGGSVVGVADIAQNLQVAAMKMKTPAEALAEAALAESQGQTEIMEDIAGGIGMTNTLLSDMTSGARLG